MENTVKRGRGRPKKSTLTAQAESVTLYTPEAKQVAPEVPQPDQADVPTPDKSEDIPQRYLDAAKRRAADRSSRLNLSGTQSQKLLAPPKAGFKRRWVNDEGNRLDNMARKGYSYVSKSEIETSEVYSTDQGDKISQVVGTSDGTPIRAYLMEIPTEWFEEDSQERENEIRKKESQIKTAKHGASGLNSTELYNPNAQSNQLNV